MTGLLVVVVVFVDLLQCLFTKMWQENSREKTNFEVRMSLGQLSLRQPFHMTSVLVHNAGLIFEMGTLDIERSLVKIFVEFGF